MAGTGTAKAGKGKAGKGKKKETVTLINFLLDKSGSMNEVLDSTISGFNEYLDSQKSAEGRTLFSLTTFNTQGAASQASIQSVYVGKPVAEVPALTRQSYVPGGMTPLYDAIGETLARVEDRIEGSEEKPDVVLFVIMTDGLENKSREYTAASIKPLIERAEKELGWTFVFLGANQNVWAAGATLGISKGNVLDYTASYRSGDVQDTFDVLSRGTERLRSVACMAAASGDDRLYQEARKDFWAGEDRGDGKDPAKPVK